MVRGSSAFFIYVNDTSYSADQLKFHYYADDTYMPYIDRILKSLEAIVNFELSSVCDWLRSFRSKNKELFRAFSWIKERVSALTGC